MSFVIIGEVLPTLYVGA